MTSGGDTVRQSQRKVPQPTTATTAETALSLAYPVCTTSTRPGRGTADAAEDWGWVSGMLKKEG